MIVGVLAGIGVALVFAAGFFLRDLMDMPSVLASNDHHRMDDGGYPLLDEVQGLIDNHYLRQQPGYGDRQYAAIRGMLLSLDDPNTFFIDPPIAQSESDVLAGTYGGIGVNLQRNAAGEFVMYPFLNSPASKAGIRDGDVLVSVNHFTIELTEAPDVVDQMLRGEVKGNNGVTIAYVRDGEEMEQFILFDVINVPSVLWRVLAEDDRLGYIQILRFTSRTPDEVAEAIEGLLGVQALILDMRNNSGGLLQESIEVAGVFLDGEVVLFEQTRGGEREFKATKGVLTELPLIVLVNRGTASAAELVAGAIQDWERGILIGQPTFGKGTIQQIFPLSDSSSIHITSAEWFTPDRHVLDGVGLSPDIEMIPDENGRDVEIGEAIRYLQKAISGDES